MISNSRRIFKTCVMGVLCVLAALVICVPQSHAQRREGIAAVVNQDAITFSDIAERTRLVLASSGLPDTPEMRARVQSRVLEILIEEQIKLQEAEKQNITVSDEDVDRGLDVIAGQNDMTRDAFVALLGGQGIPVSTLRRQIRAQIGWTRVVEDVLAAQVRVTDGDLDNRIETLRANLGRTEYLVSEIFLPIERDSGEGEARQLAQEIVTEVRAGRVPFGGVARQFSQAAGATQGGLLGWIQRGQLADDLDSALGRLAVGGVSDPIRTPAGLHILALHERRTLEESAIPSREVLTNEIGLERLERVQRRHLMDLRANSYVDSRV